MSTRQTVYEAVALGVPAWLVIDRLENGLAFGGFRFSDSVSLDQVRLLASTMSWKLAAHGLPVGGAKAGVCCRPDHPRIDAILADLASAWREPLSNHAVLGKDMGATDALLDRLYQHLGKPQLHLVQAREPGCPGRIRDLTGYVRDMTGLGAVVAAEAAVGSLQGKRLLIQGAGVVGTGVAVRAAQRGAMVVGMSDVHRAVVSANGLPVAQQVLAAREAGRPFRLASLESAGGTRVPRDGMLGEPADILFLAAGSHVVSEALARDIQAGVVVEVSNFGLTEEANAVLFERGVPVVPDVISSSSSAAMTSYQLAEGNRWQSAALWGRIENNIRTAVAEGMRRASQARMPLREAYKSMYIDALSRCRPVALTSPGKICLSEREEPVTTGTGYDLREEGRRVMQQMKDGPNPVVEARQMMSQTILAHVLLGLSDAGFYEHVAGRDEFSMGEAARSLGLDRFTFEGLLEYLLGCGVLVRRDGDVFGITPKGERLFNVYTRGVLNVYLGGYSAVLQSLGRVLSRQLPLDAPSLRRSTRHAAAGTAYSTCAFTIPDVFSAMRGTGGRVCLDLGCGTGDFLLQWVLQRPGARGVGVDLSADALRRARDTAERWGVADRLEFHEARVGPGPLTVPPGALDEVDLITSMYMLHEFGRDGRQAVVDVVRALKAQLPGRRLLVLEVEACDPEEFAAQAPAAPHLGRLDYRLIHQLSGQGLPRSQADWHGIFRDAGCSIVEPGRPTGGSLIYIVGT